MTPNSKCALTFVIFTFNEEKRITRVIRNLQSYGKVLIVDNYSTDSTREIAAAYNCDILLHKNTGWAEDELTVKKVKKKVITDWIYWGYADEMLDSFLLNKIDKIINEDKYDIINVVKKNYYYGEFCYDAFSARLNRIFKKNAIDFTQNKIHHFGRPVVDKNKICVLDRRYYVHHFISDTAHSYIAKLNRYSGLETEVGLETNPIGIGVIILKAIKKVWVNIILGKGYKAGKAGLSLLIIMLLYDIFKDMKFYEYQNSLSSEEVESKNDAVRDEILGNLKL